MISEVTPGVTTMTPCRADGCDTEVPDAAFMCDRHWSLVPPSLRGALGTPAAERSPTYARCAQAAVAAVAHAEARRVARTPRPPGKPVQLALFDVRPAKR